MTIGMMLMMICLGSPVIILSFLLHCNQKVVFSILFCFVMMSGDRMFTSCGPCRYGWLAGNAGYALG